MKPGYWCFTVSENQCFEDCVNRQAASAKKNPPCYQFGGHQCNDWVNEVEQVCVQSCALGKKSTK
jgi:hypothetical protein